MSYDEAIEKLRNLVETTYGTKTSYSEALEVLAELVWKWDDLQN